MYMYVCIYVSSCGDDQCRESCAVGVTIPDSPAPAVASNVSHFTPTRSYPFVDLSSSISSSHPVQPDNTTVTITDTDESVPQEDSAADMHELDADGGAIAEAAMLYEVDEPVMDARSADEFDAQQQQPIGSEEQDDESMAEDGTAAAISQPPPAAADSDSLSHGIDIDALDPQDGDGANSAFVCLQ